MKVLLVNQLFPPATHGGAEISVQLLAEGLQQQGVEVAVACLGPRDGQRQHRGVRVHEIGLRNLRRQLDTSEGKLRRLVWHGLDLYNTSMARQLSRVVELEGPDLVHSNVIAGFSVAIWDRLKRHGLPLVHTLRDYYLLCPRSTMFHRQRNCAEQCRSCRLFSLPKRSSANSVDHVIGISRFVLERHRGHGWFTSTPHSVIRNAVVPPPPPGPATKSRLRLGYLGRLHPSKGVDRLLRAFAEAELGDAVLRVAGAGEDAELARLHGLAAGLPVEFLGYVPPAELFARIDVLVVPSLWHEPLGRVVLEAQAHGLPVLAARRGGIPEIVEEGRSGWLFDPDNHLELVAQLQAVARAQDSLDELRSHCLRAGEAVAPARIAGQHAELYRELLQGGQGYR